MFNNAKFFKHRPSTSNQQAVKIIIGEKDISDKDPPNCTANSDSTPPP